MNKGVALYKGQRVAFSECIKNTWCNRLDYMIVWNGSAIWVKDSELMFIQYIAK